MKQKVTQHETWLDLSAAAQYLGVHFTTLRRWADSGDIGCIRTPGGRRRFAIKDLEQFIHKMYSLSPASGLSRAASYQPLEARAIIHARESVQIISSSKGSWLDRMDEGQRLQMRGTGHRLMALLLQYNSRVEGGEAFLEEGKRIAREYALVCHKIGLSLQETVQVFLFFRRSILDSIHETGFLEEGGDHQEGLRLFRRTTEFLDDLLLDLIGSYPSAMSQIP